jgi:hypothetical protein
MVKVIRQRRVGLGGLGISRADYGDSDNVDQSNVVLAARDPM